MAIYLREISLLRWARTWRTLNLHKCMMSAANREYYPKPPPPPLLSPWFYQVSLIGAYVKLLVKEGASLVLRPFTLKRTFQLKLHGRIWLRNWGGTE